MEKRCVLYDRVCIGCGECERCDLDPNKKCDNCMKCVLGDAEYRAISVDGFRLQKELPDEKPQPSGKPSESGAAASGDDTGLDWDALMSGFDA